MDSKDYSKEELLLENEELRIRLSELEALQAQYRLAKECLEQSEQKYHHLFEDLAEAAFLADAESGSIVETNRQAELLLGRKREEILKMRLSELHFGEKVDEHWQRFCAIQKVEPVEYDCQAIQKDGLCIPVSVSLAAVDISGRKFILALFHDATEQKKYEDEIRASKEFAESLISSMKDGITVYAPSGRLINVNTAFCEITGFSREELIGLMPPFPFWPEEEIDNLTESFLEILNEHFEEAELVFKRKNGEHIPVLRYPSCIRDRKGTVISFLATMKDVSHRQKIECELLKSQKLESLGVLAGGIAHDFNNLLTAILSNIFLAKQTCLSELPHGEGLITRLFEAEKALLRAKDLSKQLLTFAKGGSPVKKPLAIGDLLREAASFAMHGSNVAGEFNIPPDLFTIEADEGQITQVIHNIIINGEQSMPEGGVISVSAENVVCSGPTINLKKCRYVKISIADHGSGIPTEYQNKIFDPYFTTKERGSGLGLATAYSIVKKHGGYISFHTGAGSGTTFYIYLPASGKRIVSKKAEADIACKGRVLVMDDDELIRKTAGEILTKIGCTVTDAADGAKAIELYMQAKENGEPFDLVIMDLTIPGGLGGKETIRRLLELDPTVKAVVSSGYSNDPVLSDYRHYGFKGVIVKPYEISELRKTLSRLLHNASERAA